MGKKNNTPKRHKLSTGVVIEDHRDIDLGYSIFNQTTEFGTLAYGLNRFYISLGSTWIDNKDKVDKLIIELNTLRKSMEEANQLIGEK